MEIFDGDVRYRVKFSHIRTCYKPTGPDKMDSYRTLDYTKVQTLCEIFTGDKDNEVLVGFGSSIVERDNFSRLVGRYISFYRALINMGLLHTLSNPHIIELRKIFLRSFHASNDRAKANYICKSRGFNLESLLEGSSPSLAYLKHLEIPWIYTLN